MNEIDKAKQREIKIIITFLKETKEGKYAKVEESTLKQPRIKEERIIINDEYYYGVR